MLARFRLADPQLRVLAASPMDRQDDLARRLVDVGNDVGDKGAKQPLSRAHRHAGRVPCGVGDRRPVRAKSGDAAAGSGIRTASNRAYRLDATERASQLFSSCAAMRRLSGSQAA